tara:strand:+ start:586 stop:720 length:135 start_codon:yes stop_codon:yes gene_type:complete
MPVNAQKSLTGSLFLKILNEESKNEKVSITMTPMLALIQLIKNA